MATEAPFSGSLVVEHDRRLREERHEAMLQPQLSGNLMRVLGSACAPAVERRVRLFERRYSVSNGRDGDALVPRRPHQRVVDIDENDFRSRPTHDWEPTIAAFGRVKAYTCAYHRDRGATVCGSSLRRPVESLNRSIVSWIRENVLAQNVVTEALRYVRQLLGARTQISDVELTQLRQDADRLRGEIDRLVQALATSSDNPQAVVEAIASRQQRLAALEGQLRAAQAAPEAISLQARRLEGEARRSLGNFSRMLDNNPNEARSAMLSLFDGPIVCTPVETSEGPRFQIEGTAVIGRIFTIESSVSNSASPRGFEGAPKLTIAHDSRWFGDRSPALLDQIGPPNCMIAGAPRRLLDNSLRDVTEPALQQALAAAVASGRYADVVNLATELEARRQRRQPAGPTRRVASHG